MPNSFSVRRKHFAGNFSACVITNNEYIYGTAQRQRRTRCSSRDRTRLEPSSLQLESRSTLGLQQ